MDKSGVDSKLVVNGNQETGVINGGRVEEDEENESKKLLLPKKGGLRKKLGKKHRRVQWNDRNGHKLTEVLEYQPSFLRATCSVLIVRNTRHTTCPIQSNPIQSCKCIPTLPV